MKLQQRVDERALYGLAAVVLLTAVAIWLGEQPAAAATLIGIWLALLIVGTRSQRAWRAFCGEHFVRHRTPDLWSRGCVLASTVFWVYMVRFDGSMSRVSQGLLFAIGTLSFYAAGKFGCSRLGCCEISPHGTWTGLSLPQAEAIVCTGGVLVGIALAVLVSTAAGELVSALTYVVVRHLSLSLRKVHFSLSNAMDRMFSAGVVCHAILIL